MTARLWDVTGVLLADPYAWMQAGRDGRAGDLLLSAIEGGDVLWCWPVRYELMVDARGPEGIAAVERTLESLREIPVDRSVQRAALATMRELAAAGSHGSHRFPLTHLSGRAASPDAGNGLLPF